MTTDGEFIGPQLLHQPIALPKITFTPLLGFQRVLATPVSVSRARNGILTTLVRRWGVGGSEMAYESHFPGVDCGDCWVGGGRTLTVLRLLQTGWCSVCGVDLGEGGERMATLIVMPTVKMESTPCSGLGGGLTMTAVHCKSEWWFMPDD